MESIKDIIKKIEKTIVHHNMLDHGDRVLVAVSGGPDSVVLLDVMDGMKEALSLDLVVAHFDHGLRPDADESETRFTASLAASRNLPFVAKKALSPMGKNGSNLEEEARNHRYKFLEHAKKTHTAQKIALGHTLDDQAETVIMRLLRGSGPTGLSGIPPVRDHHIIRPLIDITREEIRQYIADRKLRHIIDPSNSEKRHLRNRIRLDLLPQLKTYQPEIVHILGQTAGIMREENRWLETEAKRWIKGTVQVRKTGEHVVPLQAFTELAEALQGQVVRQIVKGVKGELRRISLRHIDAVKSLAQGKRPQGRLNLPNGLWVKKTYDILTFMKNGERPDNTGLKGFHYVLDGPGVFHLDAISCIVTLEEMKGKTVLPDCSTSPWVACLNADRISYPLVLRSFLPGDKFVPLGMTGHKKLKDFFVDLKIPSEIRKRLPLLCLGDNPIWACGLRLDDRFKINPETEKALRVSIACLENDHKILKFISDYPPFWVCSR